MFVRVVSLVLLVLSLVLLRSTGRMRDVPPHRLLWRLTVAALLMGCGFSAGVMPDACAQLFRSLSP